MNALCIYTVLLTDYVATHVIGTQASHACTCISQGSVRSVSS